MRRHLSLILSLLLLAAAGTAFGVASAGATTSKKPVAKAAIRIVAGSACKPAAEFCFKPTTKTVVPGTRVTWKNTTITIHTVTRCSSAPCGGVSGGTGTDTGFGSPGTIGSGKKYSFTFEHSGTYVYYCQIHGYALMHGTITVS